MKNCSKCEICVFFSFSTKTAIKFSPPHVDISTENEYYTQKDLVSLSIIKGVIRYGKYFMDIQFD